MVLLGFSDDVLDLPWRYKLALPCIASLPLLCTYSGVTTVLVPKFARSWLWDPEAAVTMGEQGLTTLGAWVHRIATVDTQAFGALVDLGWLYLVYMGMLAVFSTNTINIYAGINGLEAGQTLIIAVAIFTANSYELSNGAAATSPHFFSATLCLPFIAITCATLY